MSNTTENDLTACIWVMVVWPLIWFAAYTIEDFTMFIFNSAQFVMYDRWFWRLYDTKVGDHILILIGTLVALAFFWTIYELTMELVKASLRTFVIKLKHIDENEQAINKTNKRCEELSEKLRTLHGEIASVRAVAESINDQFHDAKKKRCEDILRGS